MIPTKMSSESPLMRYLANEKTKRRYDYANRELMHFYDEKDKDYYDINVAIPIYKRTPYVLPCVTYMHRAAAKAGIKVKILIVHCDEKLAHLNAVPIISKIPNIEYIYVTNTVKNNVCEPFNKSFCYNLAYYRFRQKTKWTIFHDIDVLVPEDYFIKVMEATKSTNKNWIQPFSGKSIYYLTEDVSREIMSDPNKYPNLYEFRGNPKYRKGDPGAPGGSIVVSSYAFEQVGGYDPEIFWGNSPEDAFFWSKLEAYSGAVPKVNHCHYKYGCYINDLDLFHLWHPIIPIVTSHDRSNMVKCTQYFWALGSKDKQQFVKFCAECFKC